jgi:hypothetical protein
MCQSTYEMEKLAEMKYRELINKADRYRALQHTMPRRRRIRQRMASSASPATQRACNDYA